MYQKTILANGVRVVSEFLPMVRSVSVGVYVATGSRDEAENEYGMAHFIEHLVFKGTKKRKMHHIAQRLESVGGYLNAYTSKEYTCFYARAMDEHCDRALELVLDLVLNPTFPEKELEKEKDVVIEEMKMYDDAPDDAIFDDFEKAVYGDQSLAHPILGTEETVRAFTQSQLHDYLNRHYGVNKMVVALSGNINHDKAVRMVEKCCANVERFNEPPKRIQATFTAPEHHLVHKPIQQAHLVIGSRSISIHNEQRNALSVLNTLLSGGMSSRLNMNIREKYGYCYSIYSFVNMFEDTGDFGVYMGTDERKIDRSKALILNELSKVVESPISPKTLAQIKQQIKAGMMLEMESTSNRMMRLGKTELYFREYYTLDEIAESIDAVTANEVQMMAAELFAPANMSSVVYLPKE